jgi:thioredoxin-like negative regulator of GroEL
MLGLGLGVVAAGWGVVGALEDRRFHAALRDAEQAMAAGRYGSASQRLAALAVWRPHNGAVAYNLGLCEQALGHADKALEAWARVPRGSSYFTRATLHRARLLIDAGRFAPAEALLESLPRSRGPDAESVRQTLELLYRFEGRLQDVRLLILESWTGASDPARVLRRLYLLDHSAFPVPMVRDVLRRADPADDRVWLGQANLAILTGHLEEAARHIEACLKRRPDDLAVWRAALDLAVATGDAPGAWRALEHLPADQLTESERLRLHAWFAAARGDAVAERHALGIWATTEPGSTRTWDRLAELAFAAGRTDEAEGYRRRKAEVNNLLARYKALIGRDDRAEHARELRWLAARLGRRIEARGWALIARGTASHSPLVPEDLALATASSLFAEVQPELLSAHPEATSSGPIPQFTDDAEAAGLRFVFDNGHLAHRRPPPPETMSGGVALLDYDGDGWLDVYVVQGGPFPPPPLSLQHSAPSTDRLFRNRGDGTFEDVTERAGLAAFTSGYGQGVTAGDIDNDGHPDLFVTRWRAYGLYRNRGDGTFEDITARAGLSGDRDWPTSAAFADLDNDGDLDLYVCHYLAYDETNPKRCEHPEAAAKHECSPLDFDPLPDHVFRNDNGRFTDVTEPSGMSEHEGRGLGVVAADLDGDNRIDLYVANDMSANYLYRNLGGFQFEEVGLASGAAASADGGYKAGMGIACGDLDGDGRPDLAVTNYYAESTTFYHNLGSGMFADHTAQIGLAAPTRFLLGFGIAFFDANNDGRLDVLSANGHVLDARPQFPWMMPLQLLLGGPEGHVTEVSDRSGAPFGPPHLGRGLAVGDLDNDGRPDALVVCQNEAMVYLHNRSRQNHFILFHLEGTTSNRDGVGATVMVRAGSRRWVAPRFGGGSYQSASDPRLHFGLGAARRVDEVEVLWPSGHRDHYDRLEADTGYLLREADPVARPLAGWEHR